MAAVKWMHFLMLGGRSSWHRKMICITAVAAAFMLSTALEVPFETHWVHLVTTDEVLHARRLEFYWQSAVF